MMEGGGELAFSVHDLYPSNVNPAGPITTFVLEGTKLKVPEVYMLLIVFNVFMCQKKSYCFINIIKSVIRQILLITIAR